MNNDRKTKEGMAKQPTMLKLVPFVTPPLKDASTSEMVIVVEDNPNNFKNKNDEKIHVVEYDETRVANIEDEVHMDDNHVDNTHIDDNHVPNDTPLVDDNHIEKKRMDRPHEGEHYEEIPTETRWDKNNPTSIVIENSQ